MRRPHERDPCRSASCQSRENLPSAHPRTSRSSNARTAFIRPLSRHAHAKDGTFGVGRLSQQVLAPFEHPEEGSHFEQAEAGAYLPTEELESGKVRCVE